MKFELDVDAEIVKLEIPSANPANPANQDKDVGLEEAAELYKKRGWIQIYSDRIKKHIYLARDNLVNVPDSSLLVLLPEELEALRGLNDEELALMVEVRTIFPGVLSIGDSDKSKRG